MNLEACWGNDCCDGSCGFTLANISMRTISHEEVERRLDEALEVSLSDYFDYLSASEFLRDYFSLNNLRIKKLPKISLSP